jgi:streptogramin lyase
MTTIKTNLICATLFILVVATFSLVAFAQTNPDAKPPESQVEKIAGLNARFIVALISDGNDGAWIGTEDEGVFHWQVDGKVSQFTTKNGLGDNNGYALAIDARGRLWVGHLNTGVSVFNGKDWRNYDVVDGPIGERIFDIEICPKDGDVWIATSAGISRYKIESDEWEHFTREDGLLEDQASALAFLDDGTLIVGTQCHGLAIFKRNANVYKHSRNIIASERYGSKISHVPLTPMGKFFHSNLINDILIAQNAPDEKLGGVWIATSTGLIKANNDLTKFEFWRGKDYVDKVRGLWGGAPKDFKPAPKEVMDQLLPEDYLTCLAEDEQGVIWIGTRQNGFVIADAKTGKRAYGNPQRMGLPDNFVTKLLMLKDGYYLIGFYGGGVVKSINPFKLTDRKPVHKSAQNIRPIFSVAQNNFAKLPSITKPLTLNKLRTLQVKLNRLQTHLPNVYAAYLGEDWKTQGDWMGRAFRDWAVMCAAASPMDLSVYHSDLTYYVYPFVGSNHKPNEDVRNWVHWIMTDNPKVLWNPYACSRRQSEWDDHGEAYPMTFDGPDLWYLLEIKHEGVFKIGMYFFNKDGHNGNNRFRDYVIEFYKSPRVRVWQNRHAERKIFSDMSESVARRDVLLAKNRIRDFWGGVHKQFVVKGPGNYLVKIRKIIVSTQFSRR